MTLSAGALDFDHLANVKIPRADVAATVVAALRNPKSIGRIFQVVGGSTAIDKAVAAASR